MSDDAAPSESVLLLHGVIGLPEGETASGVAGSIWGEEAEAPAIILPCGTLGIVASIRTDRRVVQRPQVETVLAYHAVIEDVFEHRPIIPFRFGTVVDGDTEARTLIAERADVLHTQLERIAGKVEMGIRLMLEPNLDTGSPGGRSAAQEHPLEDEAPEGDPPEDAPTSTNGAPGSGAAYLRARRAAYQRDAHITEALHQTVVQPYVDALRTYADEHRVEVSQHGKKEDRSRVIVLSFLIDRVRHAAFRVEAEGVSLPKVEAHVSGPWPPYSFVQ